MSQVGRQASTYRLVLLLTFFSSDLPWAAGAAWNSSAKNSSVCGGRTKCIEGVLLPMWMPENPALTERMARATIYFVALFYMFLGVSIIADRFMASIEVITSQERKISIRKPDGEKVTTRVRVWNETVSNLTLMALGSSAPEILLSVVEVCGHNFDAGELGPNTIVGSAAFNMFVIIGLCVSVVPEGQTRRVKHLRVFFVTAAWSIFAYTWLYLILAVSTPGVVDIWEGLLTLFFFPVCVGLAYVADRRLLFYKYVYKRYRAGKRKGVIVEMEGEPRGEDPGAGTRGLQEEAPKDLKEQEGTLYICQSSRMEAGPGQVLKKSSRATDYELCSEGPDEFSSTLLLESCSSLAPEVLRRHDHLKTSVSVDYRTEDGTARASSDCQSTRGGLDELSTTIVDNHVSGAAPGLPSISDHAGVFMFEEKTVTVSKNIGVMEVRVLRTSGAHGVVALPYGTTQGTARGGGENFEDTRGVLEFGDNEMW